MEAARDASGRCSAEKLPLAHARGRHAVAGNREARLPAVKRYAQGAAAPRGALPEAQNGAPQQ